MADIEEKSVQSMIFPEGEKNAKYKSSTMESENLKPSSLQMAENTILDAELGNPAEFQETEIQISSHIKASNMPKLSKLLDNQSSLVPETDKVAKLSLKEVKNRNEFHFSRKDTTSIILPEDKEPLLQKHNNGYTESGSLKPTYLQMTGSAMSPIRDLGNGGTSESQQDKNKTSSSAITMPTLSKMHSNQSSVKSETYIVKQYLRVPKVDRLNSRISGGLRNKQKVNCLKFSEEVSRNNLQPMLESGLQLTSIFEKFHVFLRSKLKQATKLDLIALPTKESESNRTKCRIILEIMECIKNWLDRIKQQNEHYAKICNTLYNITTEFSKLEKEVEEKLNFLNIGRSFSKSDLCNQSEYETFIYDSLYTRGEKTLLFLKDIKKKIDTSAMEFGKELIFYLNSLYQISMYPFEEKISERGEIIHLINKVSVTLNKITLKLEEKFAFVEFFAFTLTIQVHQYFVEIDNACSL